MVQSSAGQTNLPSFDWTKRGLVTPVRDQGKSENCWIIASTTALEANWALRRGAKVVLSAQPVILAELFPAPMVEATSPGREPKAPAVGIIAAMLVAVLVLLPWWRPNDLLSQAPPGITQYVIQNIPSGARMFVHQPWGSWFEYRTPDNPVFVDSRIEIYSSKVWSQYWTVSTGRPGWSRVLDRWGVGAVVTDRKDFALLIPRLRHSEEWRLVYRDQQGLVFARNLH